MATKPFVLAPGVVAVLAGIEVTVRGQGQACTMPGKGRYSAGALAEHEGQMYLCVKVYGENLAH
jgi:hypothetical protein